MAKIIDIEFYRQRKERRAAAQKMEDAKREHINQLLSSESELYIDPKYDGHCFERKDGDDDNRVDK